MFSKITKEQTQKILKVALYAGISAGISALIALIAANPVLFGVLTPVVNILLVTLKQAVTEG